MNIPKISVVMPAYNAEPYIRESIESIRNQTFTDYEFIIINDGSTDGTKKILDDFSVIDKRIKVLHQENRGLVYSLNRGCKQARAKYIARMDADDVSLPTRLEKQVGYLERHPEIGILGTWIEFINEEGRIIGRRCTPVLPGLVKWNLVYGASIAHPTVLMRRTIFNRLKGYDEQAKYVEDYDLWIRAVDLTRATNLPEVLLKYRIWGKSISISYRNEQLKNTTEIFKTLLSRQLIYRIDHDSVASFREFFSSQTLHDPKKSILVSRLLLRLFRAFITDPSITREEIGEIRKDVNERLFYLAVSTFKISPWSSIPICAKSFTMNPIFFIKLFTKKVISKSLRHIGVHKKQ